MAFLRGAATTPKVEVRPRSLKLAPLTAVLHGRPSSRAAQCVYALILPILLDRRPTSTEKAAAMETGWKAMRASDASPGVWVPKTSSADGTDPKRAGERHQQNR